MAFAFEKLMVYQKAVDFSDIIAAKTETFPSRCRYLADQLNRAALSISSNLAEGNGRLSRLDKRRFLGFARGSVHECVPQLELAQRRLLLSGEEHQKYKSQLEEIARMLSGLITGLDSSSP